MLDLVVNELLVSSYLLLTDSIDQVWIKARIQLPSVDLEAFIVGNDVLCTDFQVHLDPNVVHWVVVIIVVIVQALPVSEWSFDQPMVRMLGR
jgi:hypothetical protein